MKNHVRELKYTIGFRREGGVHIEQHKPVEPVLYPRGEVPLSRARGHECAKILFIYAAGGASLRNAKGKRMSIGPLAQYYIDKHRK